MENLYARRDVGGLYSAAADTNNPEQVRHDAYWYLYVSGDGDEKAKRALQWLRDQEMVCRAQYAAEHGGSTLHFCDHQFSFDGGHMAKRHRWQIGGGWFGTAAWSRACAMWRGSSRQWRPPFRGWGG